MEAGLQAFAEALMRGKFRQDRGAVHWQAEQDGREGRMERGGGFRFDEALSLPQELRINRLSSTVPHHELIHPRKACSSGWLGEKHFLFHKFKIHLDILARNSITKSPHMLLIPTVVDLAHKL